VSVKSDSVDADADDDDGTWAASVNCTVLVDVDLSCTLCSPVLDVTAVNVVVANNSHQQQQQQQRLSTPHLIVVVIVCCFTGVLALLLTAAIIVVKFCRRRPAIMTSHHKPTCRYVSPDILMFCKTVYRPTFDHDFNDSCAIPVMFATSRPIISASLSERERLCYGPVA